jgi:RNA polymerase sigma-70 factor (ECF subfamily)
MPAEVRNAADALRWSRLIEAVAREDRVAFAELFAHFAPRVKTFMMRSGAVEASAEEVAQETLIMVWRKAALFDPRTTGAAGWIFTIARNLRIDALRREQRGGTRVSGTGAAESIEDVVDPQLAADSRMAAAQAESRVRTALSKLSDEQMRVVELSFYEDKAHGEIAKLLRIPLGTVKSRLRLAMERLRGLLGDLA